MKKNKGKNPARPQIPLCDIQINTTDYVQISYHSKPEWPSTKAFQGHSRSNAMVPMGLMWIVTYSLTQLLFKI